MDRFVRKLSSHNNSFPVILRRSVGGHSYCERYKHSISSHEAELVWKKVVADEGLRKRFVERYRWNQQSSMSQYIADTMTFYNVSFLDVNVDELTKGRYDAHKGNDCLHFLGAGRSVYRSWVHMINTQPSASRFGVIVMCFFLARSSSMSILAKST